MKDKVKLVIGIIVVLAATFIYAHIAKMNVIYDKTADSSEYVVTGVGDGTVEQTFTCGEETLDGISVKCTLLGDTSDVSVKLTLVDVSEDKTVAETELKASDMKNSKFNVFSFDTVDGCKDKEYRVILENVNEDIELGNGVEFSYLPSEDKTLQINDRTVDGTLILKTVTNRFDIETFVIVLVFVAYIVAFFKFLYKLFS